MKSLFAIHVCRIPVTMVKGKWVYEVDERPVEVMALASGFAMVRRKGAMPYVCELKEIRWTEASTERDDVKLAK